MFEDSLLESGGSNSKLHRRGPWATVLSFIIQSALVGLLVLIPLIYTQTLPTQQLVTYLEAPPPPAPPPPPAAPAAPVVKSAPKPVPRVIPETPTEIKAPTKIPDKIVVAKEPEQMPPPVSGGVVGGVAGGVPGGVPGGVVGGVPGGVVGGIPTLKAVAPPPPPPPPPSPQRVKVSAGVTAGMLEHKVQPMYPQMARLARISGAVVLQAVIGKDGRIENLKATSGHPMLIQSAIDAVRQWRYKPYYLNGQPVEVDTQITVNFVLAGG